MEVGSGRSRRSRLEEAGTLRIGVDATCWANRRGFGRFTRCLVTEMVARDATNEYVLVLGGGATDPDAEPLPPGAEVATVAVSETQARAAAAAGSRRVPDMLRMTAAVRRLRCDVFYFPASYSWFPVVGPPVVVTVHDAIAERLPELTLPTRADRLRWRLKQAAALHQSRAVITVSQASRRAVTEALGVPSERLHVIRESPAPIFRPPVPAQRARLARFGRPVEGRYLLYVGGISPHKNIETLIEAFELVAVEHPDLHLVLVGDTDDDPFLSATASVRQAIATSPASGRIVLTGYVPDDDLVALYGGAVALGLPSLGEGFGLTAAESAACGTPVVASRDPALVELLGEAGLYADARRPAEFAQHFADLLSGPQRRADVSRAVTGRAAGWSWAAAADATVGILESAARRRG